MICALQPLAFPAPFDPDLLWDVESILSHIEIFPEGQFVALVDGQIVGSCSNTRVLESVWNDHEDWESLTGGADLSEFPANGELLFGMDISVHPDFRKVGIGRGFYEARFQTVQELGLKNYVTACRIPGYSEYAATMSALEYGQLVNSGALIDKTLTPLLRYNMRLIDVKPEYMDDPESLDHAALLEWNGPTQGGQS